MGNQDLTTDKNIQEEIVLQEPIAIIGIGCRYSGNIRNLDDFWQTLIEKKSTISDVPEDRFQDIESLVDAERSPGKIVTKRGGWLDELREFDAKFFKISPREAEKVDPHQRLMLEVTFQALEDAGLKLEDVWGTKTGVFAGMWSSDFEHVLSNASHDMDVYSTTGSGRYAASGRLAYFFNLQGPTFTLDTACSTSLVAVHLAAQSLQFRETNLVVCSAANLILDPFISVGYSRSRLLSDYGMCRFGAKDASGYVRTEGAATVILKRLSDAQRDGDKIHAIIPGSACNSDGQSHKYMMAPSAITQEIMIKDALKRANVAPSLVQYVEGHGTGTKAGDPAELASIPAALSEGRAKDDIFYVGSIKTNLGHTEAASGFAGMIKTVLAIENRIIPGNLYADQEKNPNIPWDKLSLKIPDQAVAWPHPERPLLAGVNSFGISGTNAHVLLLENVEKEKPQETYFRDWKLFPISGLNEEAVKAYATKYKSQLIEKKFSEAELLNYTKNVAIRKADLPQRAVVLFKTYDELIELLDHVISGNDHVQIIKGYSEERPLSALVFPGQGSQWSGMGSHLYHSEPVFKNAIDACEKAFAPYVSWKLTEELFSTSGMQTIDVIQPALVAIEIALAEWWLSNGLVADGVIGHSMGEVAAAYISGAISLDDASKVICTRSQLMKQTSGNGSMAYLAIPPEEAIQYLKGKEHLLSLGVNNSPKSSVVSGDPTAINNIIAELEQKGVFARKVKVDVASHSPQMDPLLGSLQNSLQSIHAHNGCIPFYSTVNAYSLSGENLNAEYWKDNLRSTVRFADTVQLMASEEIQCFIETSPHPTLLQAIQENAESIGKTLHAIGSLEREKDEVFTLLCNVAQAYCTGAKWQWKKFYGINYTRVVLPEYPWQRERYWIEDKKQTVKPGSSLRSNGKSGHPLLQHYIENPTQGDIHIWETEISLLNFPYLIDHKIHESVVLPGAAYIEMLLAAAEEIAGSGQHLLQDVQLKSALTLPEQSFVMVQVVFRREVADTYQCTISSLQGEGAEAQWKEHVSGEIVLNSKIDRILPYSLVPEIAERGVDASISSQQHYEATTAIGLPYGPQFQTVSEIQYGENIFIGQIHSSAKAVGSLSRYFFHPSMLDGCIQVFLAAIYNESHRSTFVPVGVKRVLVHQYAKSLSDCKVVIKIMEETHHTIMGNAVIYSKDNQLIAELKGFSLSRLEQQSPQDLLTEVLYEVVWEKAEMPIKSSSKSLLFTNGGHDYFSGINTVAKVFDGSAFAESSQGYTVRPGNKDDLKTLWDLLSQKNIEFDNIILSWGLNAQEDTLNDILQAQRETVLTITAIIQSYSSNGKVPRLWLISKATEAIVESEKIHTASASARGVLRVIGNEHPEWQPSVIDLPADISHSDIQTLSAIIESDTEENEWAIRSGNAYVARIGHLSLEKNVLAEDSKKMIPAAELPFEAVTDEPGLLSNIVLREKQLQLPSESEVIIEVKALGINFMNLMSALGIYPGKERGFATLGIECAGIVTAVGSAVSHLKVGDKVMGMAYHTMSSHVIAEASLMRKIPEGLSFEEAATIPVVFLTVYYGLVTLGRLKPGEKVLIHSATGGVGLAALQVAKHMGAEIYATAGSEEKRQWLKDQGIENVYSSRTTDFADRIREATGGAGVDVVLNSLTGELMLHSLELLGSFGRFVEIGKKDVYANSRIGLEVFSRGLSYFMIDFEKMVFEKPAEVGALLEEIIPYFEKGIYQPLESKIFPVSDVRNAFDYMSKGVHIGKVVVKIDRENLFIEQNKQLRISPQSSATYLLTGGYGGLGLTFARWLIENGARHLVLTGRKGPSDEALDIIEELEQTGARIIVEQADVASLEDIQNVISHIPENRPLKGIFHLAGILDDASVMNLTEEQYFKVLKPKVNGVWNLNLVSKNLDLDYFVLFSSSTILFGSPGQTAYVAANAYMDALARKRKQEGKAALAIQWGTVAEVGLAAAAGNRADRLSDEGIAPLMPAECVEIFEAIISKDIPVVGAFRFDISKWQNSYPAAAKDHFFDLLRADLSETQVVNANTDESIQSQLARLSDIEQKTLFVEEKLKEKVGLVVKLSPDQIGNKTPFKSLGIDSLMSIQLKNQLEKTFEVGLSVTSFWTYANIKDYAQFLLSKLTTDVATSTAPVQEQKEAPIERVEPLKEETIGDDVSLDDLSKLLEDELNDL